MRQGHNNSLLVINNQFIGVNLGADYCAEHEWGINGIKTQFGIDNDKLGVDGRKISQINKNLTWLDNVKINNSTKLWSGIYFGYRHYNDEVYFNGYVSDKSPLYSQWDERGFCVMSFDDKKIAYLKQLHGAFASNDVAIWFGGGGIFENPGLCLGIASNLPKDTINNWYQKDVDNRKVMDEFKATGIEEKLKKAGKGYYALKPSRAKNGSLIYWLNPMKRDVFNFGWFTIKDLNDWAHNKGPIIKTKL